MVILLNLVMERAKLLGVKISRLHPKLSFGMAVSELEDLDKKVTGDLLEYSGLMDALHQECDLQVKPSQACGSHYMVALINFDDWPLPNEHLSANLGLVADHCYAVVKLLEIDGTRLVVLYNPWGSFGWSGAWADDDSVNWTDERKTRFEHGQSSKGTFHIPFDYFCDYFFYVDICMARPLVMIRDDWQIRRFRARFPINGSDNTNMSIVQFDVVTDSTNVEVILFLASRRTRSNHLIPETSS